MNPPTYAYPEHGADRTFNDYENPFAFSVEAPAPAIEQRSRTEAATSHIGQLSGTSRHRWNLFSRLLLLVATLGVVLVLAITRQKVTLDNVGVIAKYHYSSAFQFFLFVNGVVCLYALVLLITSFVMSKRGGGSQPSSLMFAVVIADVIACGFLLMAFAAALAVEVINRHGLKMGATGGYSYAVLWSPICHDFNTFCAMVEVALSLSAFAILNIIIGTCIDAYDVYELKRD